MEFIKKYVLPLIINSVKLLFIFDNLDDLDDFDDLDDLKKPDKFDIEMPMSTLNKNIITNNTSPNLNIPKLQPARNYRSEVNSCDLDLKESEKFDIEIPMSTLNKNRTNTLPNSNIHKIKWRCKDCNKKLLPNRNLYCCYDSIFCTPNCRDRYISIFHKNNNI